MDTEKLVVVVGMFVGNTRRKILHVKVCRRGEGRGGGRGGRYIAMRAFFASVGFEVIFIFLNGTLCSFFVQHSDVEKAYKMFCLVLSLLLGES